MTLGDDRVELIHATCVVVKGMGVLLRGPSGAGKSDLALRLIDRGATLIGDDYVQARGMNGQLQVRVPETIAGLIEVRGVGLCPMPHRPEAMVGLVIDLGEEDRMPDWARSPIAGVSLPVFRLDPRPASAPIKVELLVTHIKERL